MERGEQPASLTPRSASTGARHLTPAVCYEEYNGAFEFLYEKLKNHLPLQNVAWDDSGKRQAAAAPGVSLDFIAAEKEEQTALPVQWYRKPFLHLYVLEAEIGEYKKQVRATLRKWTQEHREKQQEWLVVLIAPQNTGGFTLGRGVEGKLKSDFTKERVVLVRKVQSIGEDWNELLKRLRELIGIAFQRQIALYQREVETILGRSTLPGWNYCNYFVVREGLIFTYMQAKTFDECYAQYEELEHTYESHRIETFVSSMKGYELGTPQEWASVRAREQIYLNQMSEFDFRHYVFARKFSLLVNMARPFAAVRLAVLFLQRLFDLALRSCAPVDGNADEIGAIVLFLASWTCSFVAAIEADERLQELLRRPLPSLASSGSSAGNADVPPPGQHVILLQKFHSALGDLLYCARSKLDYLCSIGLVSDGAEEKKEGSEKAEALFGMLERHKDWLRQQQDEAIALAERFANEAKEDASGAGEGSKKAAEDRSGKDSGEESPEQTPESERKEEKDSAPAGPVLVEPLRKTKAEQREFFRGAAARVLELAEEYVNHADLKKALSSREEFDELYIKLTEAAAERYKSSGIRERAVRRAQAEIADLHFSNGAFRLSAAALKALCPAYLEETWQGLATDMRLKLAICELELDQQLDYLSAVLALSSPQCSEEFIRRYFNEELLRLAPVLPPKTERDLASIVTCSVSFDQSRTYHVGDTIQVTCSLHSHILDPLPVDSLSFSIIEVDTESHLRLVQKIDFKQENVTLQPGMNRVTLSAPLTSKGDFLPSRLVLELGNLRLGQGFDTSATEQIVTVERSESTLELELVNSGGCYFSGQRQLLKIKIATNEDTIHVGSLTVASASGVLIPDFSGGVIVVMGQDGAVRTAEYSLASGCLQLPPCDRHEGLEIRVPVESPAGPSSHELSLLITYQKCANIQETFDIEVRVDIDFSDPLHVEQQLLQSSEELQFLQCLVHNRGPMALCLHEFSLSPPSGYEVVEDITHLLAGQVLASEKEVSVVFPVRRRAADARAGSEGRLEIQFSLNDKDDALAEHYRASAIPAFRHTTPVAFESHTAKFDIQLEHPKNVTAGQYMEFSFTVSSKEAADMRLRYNLMAPGSRWLVLGKTKSMFLLQAKGFETFHCRLMPVAVGWVKLPEVHLTANGESVGSPKEQYIYVVPKPFFSSTCLPAPRR